MSSAKKFFRSEPLSLRSHPAFNEKWVQDIIANDPSILGLGNLILKDKERIQPRAGRLDLLLQDPDNNRRYEVEIQLGKTDEQHIIRTIEYWDIERRRYPQYDHCAVIIAEDITSRFLNVINLFNGAVPIIAIQMNAISIDDKVTLTFTKIMDELNRGLVDDDEVITEVTDRNYWEQKVSNISMRIIDKLFDMIFKFAPDIELKYNKFYIGLAQGGRPNNFAIFKAQKSVVVLEIKLDHSKEIESKINDAQLDTLDYDSRWKKYRIRVNDSDLSQHKELLEELLKLSYEQW